MQLGIQLHKSRREMVCFEEGSECERRKRPNHVKILGVYLDTMLIRKIINSLRSLLQRSTPNPNSVEKYSF